LQKDLLQFCCSSTRYIRTVSKLVGAIRVPHPFASFAKGWEISFSHIRRQLFDFISHSHSTSSIIDSFIRFLCKRSHIYRFHASQSIRTIRGTDIMKTALPLAASLAIILSVAAAAQQPEAPRQRAQHPNTTTQQTPTEAPPQTPSPQAPTREREEQ